MSDKVVVFDYIEGPQQSDAPSGGTPSLPADMVTLGYLNSSINISGNKVFVGNISATNLSGTNTGDQTIVLSGHVTGSGSGTIVTAIPAGTVTNAQMADMTAARIKGRAFGAGTGAPTDLTGTQATVILDTFTGDSGAGGVKGLVPAPAAGDAAAGKFLTAAGNWDTPAGSGGGGFAGFTSVKTSDYSILSGDTGKCVLVDSTSGPINITLPTPAASFFVYVKDVSGNSGINPIYILRSGSEDIDDQAGNDVVAVAYGCVGYGSNGTDYFRLTAYSGGSLLGRAVWMGGHTGSVNNTMDYVEITTAANATDFGDLTVARREMGGCSSATRGLCNGGYTGTGSNVIDYITISTPGGATDFGDLNASCYGTGALSNSTRGLIAQGYIAATTNTIDYVTIASTGNATDFGDTTVARALPQGMASTTRGVFASGDTNFGGTYSNVIDYVTIASAGNATDFGDLGSARSQSSACSNSVRGVIGGGTNGGVMSGIEYITIATTGNATSFGSLSQARQGLAAACNTTRALFGGGNTSGDVNTVDYITIGSTGNATDFGDLTLARDNMAACSNAHGGL